MERFFGKIRKAFDFIDRRDWKYKKRYLKHSLSLLQQLRFGAEVGFDGYVSLSPLRDIKLHNIDTSWNGDTLLH